MSELLCIARLKIHHGKLDEFKHLAARCVELVRTKDTGTLQYELYFNSDNTECLVFERYRPRPGSDRWLRRLVATPSAAARFLGATIFRAAGNAYRRTELRENRNSAEQQ